MNQSSQIEDFEPDDDDEYEDESDEDREHGLF